MKIISKFKDYYDSVAWTYGGGDPKIVYVRRDFDMEKQGRALEEIAMKIEYPYITAAAVFTENYTVNTAAAF